MDIGHETWKFRILLGAILLFLVSMFTSCQELRYRIWGKSIEANLSGSHVTTSHRRGRELRQRSIEYTFLDGETFRRETAQVPLDWPGVDAPTVAIEYIPGSARDSRLLGTSQLFWVALFLGSFGFLGFWSVKTWREAYR